MEWDDLIDLLHQVADVHFDTHDIEMLDAHGELTGALHHVLLAILEQDVVSYDCAQLIREVTRDG